MTKFLAVQNTYQDIEIALFDDRCLVDLVRDDKIRASKNFIPLLITTLKKNKLGIDDLSFIAANQGPGPFTTLRVVISSVNGLGFATKIPLIGVDALDAFLKEYYDVAYSNTVILLNAFNKDVYFALSSAGKPVQKGCKNIELFLKELSLQIPDQTVRFLGNATRLYEDMIRELFHKYAYIPSALPQTCSLKQIGLIAFDWWKKNQGLSEQLLPLYLKQQQFKALVT